MTVRHIPYLTLRRFARSMREPVSALAEIDGPGIDAVSCKEATDTTLPHGEQPRGSVASPEPGPGRGDVPARLAVDPDRPNWLRSGDLADLAGRLVTAGAEGPAVCALAALSPAAAMSDAAPRFERVLRDLARPSTLLGVGTSRLRPEIAAAITTGELRPSAGAEGRYVFCERMPWMRGTCDEATSVRGDHVRLR